MVAGSKLVVGVSQQLGGFGSNPRTASVPLVVPLAKVRNPHNPRQCCSAGHAVLLLYWKRKVAGSVTGDCIKLTILAAELAQQHACFLYLVYHHCKFGLKSLLKWH